MVIKMKKGKKRGLPPPPAFSSSEESPVDAEFDEDSKDENEAFSAPDTTAVELEDSKGTAAKPLQRSSNKAQQLAEELAQHLSETEQCSVTAETMSNASNNSDLYVKPERKRKKGIIYVSNIPKHMTVTKMREILGEYGKIGRVYLQPEKTPGYSGKKKRKLYTRHFTEGWVEFESKRIAKQLAPLLSNKQISTRKKSQFYDYIWTLKYLPRFKWTHLTERMNYEQAVHKQRLRTEVSQARKETTFFQNNLDQSEYLKKKNKTGRKESNSIKEK